MHRSVAVDVASRVQDKRITRKKDFIEKLLLPLTLKVIQSS